MEYDELPLIPSVVARRVCELPYTGYELDHRPELVEAIERRRYLMTEADIRAFVKQTDERCRAAYEEKADWFMKCVRSKTTRGRDQLYAWVSHWLSSFLGNKEPKIMA
jgi:hypothetical protein